MSLALHARQTCPDAEAPPADGANDRVAQELAKALAAELIQGRIELPSPSTVVVRVRKALADPDVTALKLGQVIGTEPTLAARVIQLANSVAFNPTRSEIASLQRAIARVGLNAVRIAALSLAFTQLRKLPGLAPIAAQLERIWLRSVATAATALALARRSRACVPDEAMLAGLMVGMGRLYILSRASEFKGLSTTSEAYGALVEEWQADVAKAVLASWDMPASIVEAVHRHGDTGYDHPGAADLTDILVTANRLVESGLEPESLAGVVAAVPAAQRLALASDEWAGVMVESRDGAEDLIRALDG
jgi:HD-like signal output (HDOD) protein